MQTSITTAIKKDVNLNDQTPSLETTPLLKRIRSFRSGGPTISYTSSLSPVSPPSTISESSDGPINANSSQSLGQNRAQRGNKPALALFPAVSLRLENAGSVARDHLASERTFLAYVRTSISTALVGIVLAQILSFTEKISSEGEQRPRYAESYARPVGGIAIILSMVVLGLGVYRYFSIQRALVKGVFPVLRVGVISLALLLGALVVVAFSALFVGRQELEERL